MGIWDSIFGSSTYAESQRDKFKELVDTLTDKVGDLPEQISQAEEQIKILHKAFNSNADSAEGLIMTKFNDKHSTWHSNAKKVTNNMRQAEEDINGKIAEAQEKYEYWCEQVRLEQEAEARRILEAQQAAQQALENQ